jgi:hypothetical protein
MKYLTRIYNFEILISDSFKNGSRTIAKINNYDRNLLGIAIQREIYEEFDGDIVKVNVDMKKQSIHLLMYDNSLLYDTWREFGFRPKGISITDKFHIRLIDVI